MIGADPKAHDWFREASIWYVDKHQGCPWCGGVNQLYKSHRGTVAEYHCGSCDFFTCHDADVDRYFMAPGERRPAAVTMLA